MDDKNKDAKAYAETLVLCVDEVESVLQKHFESSNEGSLPFEVMAMVIGRGMAEAGFSEEMLLEAVRQYCNHFLEEKGEPLPLSNAHPSLKLN